MEAASVNSTYRVKQSNKMGATYLIVLFSCFVVLCAGYRPALPKKVPQLQCKRQNEEQSCVKDCPPENTCKNRGIQFSCIKQLKPCQQKCVCKKGYFRNAIGDCITGAECNQCQAPNEFFTCGPECDNECADLTQNRTNCRIQNIVCNRKCYCEDGFARNNNRTCIPVEQCPKIEKCKDPNEVFSNCKQSCPPDLCMSIVARFKCPENPKCEPGCSCKPGFLRQSASSPCVPTCKCREMQSSPDCKKKEPTCADPNEEYLSCRTNCAPDTCSSIISRYACDKPVCRSGCFCKSGFLRLKDGSCVPTCGCPEIKNSPECEKSRQDTPKCKKY